jgi:hypothetical protein
MAGTMMPMLVAKKAQQWVLSQSVSWLHYLAPIA